MPSRWNSVNSWLGPGATRKVTVKNSTPAVRNRLPEKGKHCWKGVEMQQCPLGDCPHQPGQVEAWPVRTCGRLGRKFLPHFPSSQDTFYYQSQFYFVRSQIPFWSSQDRFETIWAPKALWTKSKLEMCALFCSMPVFHLIYKIDYLLQKLSGCVALGFSWEIKLHCYVLKRILLHDSSKLLDTVGFV